MRRKVIQIADSTQLISLPRKWAQKHGIKKGDEIEVTEQGNKLLISTQSTPNLGMVEVDVTGLDRDSIMFFLRALYKDGYDEIKINFKQPTCENIRDNTNENVMQVIQHELSRLNGMEIFTQRENHCIIRTISEDTTKVFDTMLRRIFLLVAETVGDLVEGYEKGNTALLQTIQNKHDTITMFVSYSQRLLNKIGTQEYRKNNALYHILEMIDTMMDLVKYNARDILKNKLKASREGLEIYKEIHSSFNIYYDLHYNFSMKKMYEINRKRYAILDKIQRAHKKISKEELGILVNMEQMLEYVLNMVNTRVSLEY
ncbi:MAG TPA: AbrB/MazE/SpoVT family DNA-binding domain-containing protein [Candidatus Nanoarchaeia archaeon]|nr:AbrB/MazE/SpoVT family DNA-binding domain-containing protein [Candidatus Nanoarchaeia archaeon]